MEKIVVEKIPIEMALEFKGEHCENCEKKEICYDRDENLVNIDCKLKFKQFINSYSIDRFGNLKIHNEREISFILDFYRRLKRGKSRFLEKRNSFVINAEKFTVLQLIEIVDQTKKEFRTMIYKNSSSGLRDEIYKFFFIHPEPCSVEEIHKNFPTEKPENTGKYIPPLLHLESPHVLRVDREYRSIATLSRAEIQDKLKKIQNSARKNTKMSAIVDIVKQNPGLTKREIWRMIPEELREGSDISSISTSLRRIKYFVKRKNGGYYMTEVDDLIRKSNELCQKYGINKIIAPKAGNIEVTTILDLLDQKKECLNEEEAQKIIDILQR